MMQRLGDWRRHGLRRPRDRAGELRRRFARLNAPRRTMRSMLRALAPYLFVAALVAVGVVFGGDTGPRRPHVSATPEVIRGMGPRPDLPGRGAIVTGRAAVIDGDTIAIRGHRIRFEGIDAFERGQLCRSPRGAYACGRAATEALGALIGAERVECRVSGRDRYGRALAVCTAGGRDLGAALVEAGWALAARADYAALERVARAAKRGAWQGTFEPPAQWRREHPR